MKRKFNPFHSIKEELKHHHAPDATTDFSDEFAYPSSYRLAFLDSDFLLSDPLRPVRLQLELLKPEITFAENNIDSTIVVFGSARMISKEHALIQVTEAQKDYRKSPTLDHQLQLKEAERRLKQSAYYEEARKFARLISACGQRDQHCEFVITTGGGPGIMEAANRGAADVHAKTIGLNILLPTEQTRNPYVTEALSFRFHYFALRKMHFLLRARALVAFPGGFGTMDELFEALTLVQTNKIKPMPILLFCRAFWEKLINFPFLIEEGLIAEEELDLFQFVETAEEAWEAIQKFYASPIKKEEHA